ncbi:MAG: hypothetical protein WBO09_16110 [Methylocystis silviterrae]|uniref:hypothetical protein n=1 Tax=Methylocystis silviterrae TaxID=2743612 RepID=UPI003C77E8E8
MLSTRIYSEEWEVDSRLKRFGATRDELINIARQTSAHRADAIAIDPLTTAGQLSYIYGTRYKRLLFMPKGYLLDRRENVESVIHPESGIRIVYQNVDQACGLTSPQAISGKGPAANRMIDNGQGVLFHEGDLPEAIPQHKIDSLNSSVWYLCMSFNDDDVRVELSLPAFVKGKNFGVFAERIFILPGGGWGGLVAIPDSDEGPVNELPRVARR